MNLPIKWLKKYINTTKSPKQLGDIFTSLGHMQDAPIENNVLSLEVRQNRSDCFSIIGLAREIAAFEGKKIKEPKLEDIKLHKYTGKYFKAKDKSVKRFSVLHLKNIKVGESPKEIKEYLNAYGIESINNIVDITNYVMLEYGSPLHAFDMSKIKGGVLHIRKAKDSEYFTSLDKTNYKLTFKDTVISDEDGPTALLGVVGGDSTRVDNNTSEILLEAANYDQATVRRSSIRHQIRTEGSTRHEKFLHPYGVEIALQRSLQLLKHYAGGELVNSEDYFPKDPKLTKIKFNINEVERLGGVKLTKQQIIKILKSLNFEIPASKLQLLNVTVPYYRTDILQEADLVEEVLRINGYDKIPFTKLDSAPPVNISPSNLLIEDNIRDILISLGIDEQITDPLVKSTGDKKEVTFENPLNKQKDTLRINLKGTLTPTIINAEKHKIESPAYFEIGKIYYQSSDKDTPVSGYKEEGRVGVIFSSSWELVEYKGILEGLIRKLGIKEFSIDKAGQITQGTIKLGNLSNHYFYLIIDSLLKAKKDSPTKVVTEFDQEMVEDISFIVDKYSNIGPIIDSVKKNSKLISNIELIDHLEDSKFGDNKVSVTLRINYDTTNSQKVKKIRDKISKSLKEIFQAKMRD